MATYESIVNHVFMPPRLPQSDDDLTLGALLGITSKALEDFKLLLPTSQHAIISTMAANLVNMKDAHSDGFVNSESLNTLLVALPEKGGTIPLHIIKQNAGILISKTDGSTIRFESFELSPLNGDVYGTQGRLRRSFPGAAVDVDVKIFEESGFINTVANTLGKMSRQSAPGMQPQVRKSKRMVDEDRDTTHPGMISEAFMGFLRSVGRPVSSDMIIIHKNTQEEVMWKGARSPWRRTPAWLLLRVALELHFTRADAEHTPYRYKEFMVFFMSRVLKSSHEHPALSHDLCYAMGAKISRRLLKLGSSINKHVLLAITDTTNDTTAVLQKKWAGLQTRDPLPLHHLSSLDFYKDGFAALPELDEYLKSIEARQIFASSTAFQPTSAVMTFDAGTLPNLATADSNFDYTSQNLSRFESWVELHIDEWIMGHLDNPETCKQVSFLLKSYHGLASQKYTGNPETTSVMYLTILQLWMVLDMAAVHRTPLLSEYEPGLSLTFTQNLLLPSKRQMTRLHLVEEYLRSRDVKARLPSTKVFYEMEADCFAARYFDMTQTLQSLQKTIKKQAAEARTAKIAELGRVKSEYERLMTLHDSSSCQYVETVVDYINDIREDMHSSSCRRCKYSSKAEALRITIHEWPLPDTITEEKVVVFELQAPLSFAYWRDSMLYLLLDVLKADHASEIKARASYPLAQDDQLSAEHYNGTPSRRFGLLSQDKPHLHTHRKDHVVSTATESKVCLPSGRHYKYYDGSLGQFVSQGLFTFTEKVPLECTYQLPERSAAVQKFMFRPAAKPNGQSPNTVIASQSECPDHMSLDEYKKLSSIPCGYYLQWPNLLVQLGFPAIDFKKVESTLVVLQSINQAGPTGNGFLRAGHTFCGDHDSASKLVEELRVALQRIKENWESSQALSIFISIASRLLSLNTFTDVQDSCMEYLEQARQTAVGWVRELREKSQLVNSEEERVEYMSKRAEIALICVDTFNVAARHVNSILMSSMDQASILVECMIVIQESKSLLSGLADSTVQLLLLRFQRLLGRCYTTLASNRPAIDDGIAKSWTGFQSEAPWSTAASDDWLTTTTKVGLASSALRVHFNILSGELLVNGRPLDRLPRKYEDHHNYRTIFGRSTTIEVMPTAVPGMEFEAKREFSEHKIQFGMAVRAGTSTNDLLIQASSNGKTYELIPSDLFRKVFPAAFVDEHIHWLDVATGMLEFRPKDERWNDSCSETWYLAKDPHQSMWRLGRKSFTTVLLSLHSSSSKTLFSILSPLADASCIHIISHPQRLEVEVDIPGLQIGFMLKSGQSNLQSKEFPQMMVDVDQSLGTLVGLQNKLMLRHNGGSRLLLILDGIVSYDRSTNTGHVNVTIEKAPPRTSSKLHAFQVDDRLGRLVDNGSLQSKLFLAHLHAISSFCLVDPLTGKTGTEQALSMLSSAAVRSFDRLSKENVNTLSQIAALTPDRDFYPVNQRVMQSVNWSPNLGFMAQHAGFQVAVESIFEQAKKSSIFHPESALLLPDLWKSDSGLVQRTAIRTAMFRVSGFGAESFTTAHDAVYNARDCNDASSKFANAFQLSKFVYQQKQDLNWSVPSNVATYLWEVIVQTPKVPGPSSLGHGKLEYDGSLLDGSYQTAVFPFWIGLNQSLARANKFSLMIWLSTLACSATNAFDSTVLQTLALSFSRVDVAQVTLPPPCDSFRLSQGKTVAKGELRAIAQKALVGIRASPEYASILQRTDESMKAFGNRRKQAYQTIATRVVDQIVSRLAAQWPCQNPTTPDLSSISNASAYISMTIVMNQVRSKFETWFENLQFFKYLERIGGILSGLSVTKIHVPSLSLTASSSPLPWTHVGFISVEDLFAADGPQIEGSSTDTSSLDRLISRQTQSNGNTSLTALISKLQTLAAESKYEKEYVNNLRNSALELQQSTISSSLHSDERTRNDLDLHLLSCQDLVNKIYGALMSATSPKSTLGSNSKLTDGTALWSARQWPRVSPTFFLQQLSRLRWSSLSQNWKNAIVEYGLALTQLQRAERLVKASHMNSKTDLINELLNPGRVGWSPEDHPDSLLLEVESGILIRPVQEQIAGHMRDPRSAHEARNAVMQLNMGEGKSSTIVPIVAAALANGGQLVRVVVAKPQSKQMAQMMIAKLGGMLNRRVYYMPFSRALRPSLANADTIGAMLRECMADGGILLVQPEHILSFKLMGLESFILGNDTIGRSLLSTQDFFDRSSRDIVDESDENFSVKFELVYTIGTQKQVDLSPERWLCLHEVLNFVKKFSQATADALPGSLELTHCLPGRFPRTRILKDEARDYLFNTIALHICKTGLKGFPIARQSSATRKAVFTYITKLELTPAEIAAAEDSGPGGFWTESTKSLLLLLRGLFAAGVLSFALGQKRWRVNYGLDGTRNPNTKLAVPYRAKDNPSPRSEFSHPDVIIVLTTLSYYYGGLTEDDLRATFEHMTRSDQADIVYQEWVKDAGNMPKAFSLLEGINLRDNHQFAAELWPRLRYGKSTVDYFLANVVFPKEMKEFPHKLSASGWDIGKNKALPTTGFSGTNDSRTVLPLYVEQMDLPEQKHTNALVLEYLLQPNNSVAPIPAPTTSLSSTSDAERLLAMVMKLDPSPRVILDVGAQILELDNIGVATRWLSLSDQSVQAVVFFDSNDELSVINRTGRVESLQTSSFATQLDVCLVFLDESHTRGTDLRLPEDYRAAVTLGAGLTKDRIVQACMRMRKLGKGQTVVFCVPQEINTKIVERTGKPADATIGVSDILQWTISETWTDMRRSMPLWAVQGDRFVRQNALWQNTQDENGKTALSQAQANAFLDDEAQSLEDRYRPTRSDIKISLFKTDTDDTEKIKQRCQDFENLRFTSATLQEEQERELSPETEQERQVQKPAQAKPLRHTLHRDLIKFVNTGILPPDSQACDPAFSTFSRTSAAEFVDLTELHENSDRDLLVTKDFARTIDTSATGPSSQTDAFQRPVQWLLTAINPAGVVAKMLVISPYEAQELHPLILTSSKVALHLYTPRCNEGFRSLDHLGFFVQPPRLNTPTLIIDPYFIVQLNLFAGQLYINTYSDFNYLCAYLGLAVAVPAEGWVVAADGFILKDGSGHVGGAGSRLTRSPVKFLQVLMGIRRDGEGISKTHMGALLDGTLLEERVFERGA